MSETTNADRAAWARAAQDAFDAIVYHPLPGQTANDVEPLATRIKDLITNLLHLARREAGVEDLQHFVDLAVWMHDMEAAEDPEDEEALHKLEAGEGV